MTALFHDSGWGSLVGRLEGLIDLEASMREAGALQRRRAIRSASDLLRLCFGFVLGRFSLRMLASWASTEGVADLSDVAALKRLRASADWLGLLAARLLRARYPEVAAGARDQHRLVAVDATMVVPPGDKRDYWLVHTVFDLHDLTFRVVETSDRFERERLTRGGVRPGEVRIADRFHARAEELAAVRAEDAHFLVRAASTYPRLLGSNGKRLDRAALLAEADQAGSLDRPVTVASAKSKTRVAARLVIVPLPPTAAARARLKAKRDARAAGYAPSATGLEVAGYLLLLTSLDPDEWPPDRLVATYRLRWQVELAFKRLKSIVGLEDLRARDPDLARTWINTALLAALIAEDERPDLDPEAPDSLPRTFHAPRVDFPSGGSSALPSYA
jgi:Transposase DDE domain